MVVSISLTTEGKEALISECDLPNAETYKWNYMLTKGREYAYTTIRGSGRLYLHHLILPQREGLTVDHKDGNGLNNTRENLRYATHQQNLANQKLSTANTSGYKGVVRNHYNWMAQSKREGKRIYIGTYKTPQEAAEAYDDYMIRTYGEFAMTNKAIGLL